MINVVTGNLLKSDCGMICHQVNARGVMGAGIAKQIRETYPNHYDDYMQRHRNGMLTLGSLVVSEQNGKIIVGLIAQQNYGRGELYTDYQAFSTCLTTLGIAIKTLKINKIGLPYGIGCGLAGGDWSVMYGLIDKWLSQYNVYLYKLRR